MLIISVTIYLCAVSFYFGYQVGHDIKAHEVIREEERQHFKQKLNQISKN